MLIRYTALCVVSIIKTKRNETRSLDSKKKKNLGNIDTQGKHIIHMRIMYVRAITLTIQTPTARVLLHKQEHNDAVLNQKF
jgi:hypothetical protein